MRAHPFFLALRLAAFAAALSAVARVATADALPRPGGMNWHIKLSGSFKMAFTTYTSSREAWSSTYRSLDSMIKPALVSNGVYKIWNDVRRSTTKGYKLLSGGTSCSEEAIDWPLEVFATHSVANGWTPVADSVYDAFTQSNVGSGVEAATMTAYFNKTTGAPVKLFIVPNLGPSFTMNVLLWEVGVPASTVFTTPCTNMPALPACDTHTTAQECIDYDCTYNNVSKACGPKCAPCSTADQYCESCNPQDGACCACKSGSGFSTGTTTCAPCTGLTFSSNSQCAPCPSTAHCNACNHTNGDCNGCDGGYILDPATKACKAGSSSTAGDDFASSGGTSAPVVFPGWPCSAHFKTSTSLFQGAAYAVDEYWFDHDGAKWSTAFTPSDPIVSNVMPAYNYTLMSRKDISMTFNLTSGRCNRPALMWPIPVQLGPVVISTFKWTSKVSVQFAGKSATGFVGSSGDDSLTLYFDEANNFLGGTGKYFFAPMSVIVDVNITVVSWMPRVAMRSSVFAPDALCSGEFATYPAATAAFAQSCYLHPAEDPSDTNGIVSGASVASAVAGLVTVFALVSSL